MGYWDYDEPMWEPSEADELFDELKSKLVDAAKASLKNDMEYLKSRNEYLEKRNDGMIIHTEILESSLYMISSATMLLRSVNNLIIANILDLLPRKNARSIVIG